MSMQTMTTAAPEGRVEVSVLDGITKKVTDAAKCKDLGQCRGITTQHEHQHGGKGQKALHGDR